MNEIEQKQIEEMAKIIKAVKYAPFNNGKPTYTVGNQMQDFVFDLIAEKLVEQGYRNVKDKVVIDKHKYILANKCYSDTTLKSLKKEELIEQIRILEHNWASAEEKVNNQVNYLQDKVVLTEEELDRIKSERFSDGEITAKGYFEHYVLSQEVDKARKETAREILNEIGEANNAERYDVWVSLCEKYGVEVE